nr:transposase [Yoonia sediminilitoris]
MDREVETIVTFFCLQHVRNATKNPTFQALKHTCQACPSKMKCCPNADARKIPREEHEDARQVARDIAKTKQYAISMRLRKKVEMLFAHLKRILGLGRLRLRGPCGANDEFLLAATAQNLRKLAKIFPAPQQTRKA